MKDIEKRIREIVAGISAITEFAEGSITANSKQCTLKNGTVRRASPQYRSKSRGARGKQVSKYVPPAAVAGVKKLIENGKRYRKLVAMADGTNAPCATPSHSRSSRTTSCTRAAT